MNDPDSTLAGRSGAIPGVRLAEARAKLMQDQAAVEVASVKWKALGLPTEILDAVIRNPLQPIRQTLQLASPIDGVVTHTDLSIGKVVDHGRNHVAGPTLQSRVSE